MYAPRILFCAVALLASFSLTVQNTHAAEGQEFSIVILPDTQFYSETYPDNYLAQTRWIRDHRDELNIKFVIHLGDIVQNHNDREQEWRHADQAHKILDETVPYSMLPGNHDMGKDPGPETRETPLYNKYFGPQRFAQHPWYGGHFGDTNDNNFCTFEASGMEFLVLSLEYAPRQAVLDWAQQVIAAHPTHRVILATHCYMRPKGRDKAIGQRIWDQVVRKHEHVFLAVGGHVLGVGYQASRNDAGGVVHEMLVDYQGLPNGGNGWLRLLRFVPGENKIHVRGYSPLLDQSNDDRGHTFSLDYSMESRILKKAG